MCGDPECRDCFPDWDDHYDNDDDYERYAQERLDYEDERE